MIDSESLRETCASSLKTARQGIFIVEPEGSRAGSVVRPGGWISCQGWLYRT